MLYSSILMQYNIHGPNAMYKSLHGEEQSSVSVDLGEIELFERYELGAIP